VPPNKHLPPHEYRYSDVVLWRIEGQLKDEHGFEAAKMAVVRVKRKHLGGQQALAMLSGNIFLADTMRLK
jgi:hypothetical protein